MLYSAGDITFNDENFDEIVDLIFSDYPQIKEIFKGKSWNNFLLKFLETLNKVIIELAPLDEQKEKFIVEKILSEYEIWKKIVENKEKLKNKQQLAAQGDQIEADDLLQNI